MEHDRRDVGGAVFIDGASVWLGLRVCSEQEAFDDLGDAVYES